MAITYGMSEATKEFLKKLPKRVRSLEDIETVSQKLQQELDSIEDKGLINKFNRWRKQLILNNIKENTNNAEHAGAKGEEIALKKLSELPDDFHVFCGVNQELENYVTYREKRNLRSAQMDFVVVSQRGVNVIEVKNWSTKYYNNFSGLSPHEQVDRAGTVLWLNLKSLQLWSNDLTVTSVLLPIQETISYDKNYGHVFVKNINRINYFLENQPKKFSDKEVERLIDRIKRDITK